MTPDYGTRGQTVDIGTHRVFYLQSGPDDGPAILFLHGWPELSRSWRHVLPCFGALGFRAIAPDMRGYGGSSAYADHAAYAQEKVVGDIIGLADALGIRKAVWVGHDWGSPTAWLLAAHHPGRTHAVASLCIPYRTIERGVDALVDLVDRDLYPADLYPWGQWAYQVFYHRQFGRACDVLGADPSATIRALMRRGNPDALGKPSPHVQIFANGGWFGGADRAPDLPRDPAVLSEDDVAAYAESLSRNGFFGPDSYYMNEAANRAYADRAPNGGVLDMPALFIAGRYDITCESVLSRFGDPMRAHCRDLTEAVADSGHWMAQERPREVNAILAKWLAAKVPGIWPAG